MKRNELTNRISKVEWSGIRKMNTMAEKIGDVVNLGIGQPDFDTPEHIRNAAKNALDEGYTRYPPARGFFDLREAVSKKLQRQNRIAADPESEIMITVGAMQVVFNTMLNFVEDGDEVIIADPGYDYYSQIRLFGGVPVRVQVHEENQFKIDPKDIEKAVSRKTKLIVLNTPSNPTGAVFDKDILKEIAKIAQQNGIFVFSDEPYEDLVFDGKEHVSIASLPGMKDLTVTAFTFSKSYAMTGWRVGYAVSCKRVVDEMEKLMEHLVSGVTAVSQRAALAAIQGSQGCVKEMADAYLERRNIVYNGLNDINRVSCIMPESTFYAFPNISKLKMSSWDLAEYLLKNYRVVTIPGVIFGKGGEGYLRLSFAVDSETLQEGIRRIANGIAALKY